MHGLECVKLSFWSASVNLRCYRFPCNFRKVVALIHVVLIFALLFAEDKIYVLHN